MGILGEIFKIIFAIPDDEEFKDEIQAYYHHYIANEIVYSGIPRHLLPDWWPEQSEGYIPCPEGAYNLDKYFDYCGYIDRSKFLNKTHYCLHEVYIYVSDHFDYQNQKYLNKVLDVFQKAVEEENENEYS